MPNENAVVSVWSEFDLPTLIKRYDPRHLQSVPQLTSLVLAAMSGFDGRVKHSWGNALAQNALCEVLFAGLSYLNKRNKRATNALDTPMLMSLAQERLVSLVVFGLFQAIGWFAPQALGAEFTADWVSDALSAESQKTLEAFSYSEYLAMAFVMATMANFYSRSTLNKFAAINLPANAKPGWQLAGIAVAETAFAGALYASIHAMITQIRDARPRVYAPLDQPALSANAYFRVNSLGLMRSCQDSAEENFFSGHSAVTGIALGATLVAFMITKLIARATAIPYAKVGAVLALLTALTGSLATVSLRVLSDCHSPSAAITGLMMGVVAMLTSQQVMQSLLKKLDSARARSSHVLSPVVSHDHGVSSMGDTSKVQSISQMESAMSLSQAETVDLDKRPDSLRNTCAILASNDLEGVRI